MIEELGLNGLKNSEALIPDFFNRDNILIAVNSPSPVFANSVNKMCPEGSPPSLLV